MRRIHLSAFALIALILLSAPLASANLLVNGSFEQPFSTVSQWTSIPGWTRTCGTTVEIQNAASMFLAPFDGNQWWESDGVDNTCLAQTIATQFNTVYRVTFAHSARPGVKSNAVAVYWNGSLLTTVDANGLLNTNTAWQVGSFYVVASGPSSTLEFRAAGRQDQLGGFIDGVSVEEVVICN